MEGLACLWYHRGGRFGLILVVLVILLALFAPLLTPCGPNQQIPGHGVMRMSREHPFGTDVLGRDVCTRSLFGALSVGLGACLGTFMAITAGYPGGWTDATVMRLSDAISAFPALLPGAAVVVVLRPGFVQGAIAIAQSPLCSTRRPIPIPGRCLKAARA